VLPYSVASVLDQTFTDFEVLVIGDACTDDSADVVAAIDDRRVQWHNLPVRVGHQSGPNNEGIRRGRGSVIAYLGHDDLWLPRHLELLVSALGVGAGSGGEAGMAYARTLYVLPDQAPKAIPAAGKAYEPGTWIPPTAVAHNRSFALDVGGWRGPSETGTLDPESDLWKRMTAARRPPAFVPTLTNVKLPAAFRQNVYRLRPHHEQAEWLARIREADAPERALLERCAREPRVAPFVHALWNTLRRRVTSPPTLASAEERARSTRRYKGLED
jgi:glycosyltransferase involved in cell wall biosynthesis